jgi:hypothetical protein
VLLLLLAASLATYTGLLRRECRGKSPMVNAGQLNSSSPAAASRRRQQQLKCVPEHHVELLQALGLPALVNAPTNDGLSDEKSAASLRSACAGLADPLIIAFSRLAQQLEETQAYPSCEQQLVRRGIVKVAAEVAVLAPEMDAVRPATLAACVPTWPQLMQLSCHACSLQ